MRNGACESLEMLVRASSNFEEREREREKTFFVSIILTARLDLYIFGKC